MRFKVLALLLTNLGTLNEDNKRDLGFRSFPELYRIGSMTLLKLRTVQKGRRFSK